MKPTDRELGMFREISRRDFINDVSLSALALGLPLPLQSAVAAHGESTSYYPPSKTGLRGAHPGSFEIAHALAREGKSFEIPPADGPEYDLVVVGAGLSGLSAAYYYQKLHGPTRRILILDNHDDFGGHAKRNEFHSGDNMRLAWGGTVNLEYPKYSKTALTLIEELGIEIPRLVENSNYGWVDENPNGYRSATWFGDDIYARDVLLPGTNISNLSAADLAGFVAQIPISEASKRALHAFLTSTQDVLSELSTDQKAAYLRTVSYQDFLKQYFGLADEAINVFNDSTIGYWGVRAGDLSVAECLGSGLPGSHVLGDFGNPSENDASQQAASAMFPDGNASIARLLVRALIPSVFDGMPAEADPLDIVEAKADYRQLDRPIHPVQIRLNSTAIHARNEKDNESTLVSYSHDGKLSTVRSGATILACYNRIIPDLCPQLPSAQKAALKQSVKRPMLIMNALLKNGQAVDKSGISGAYLPGRLCQTASVISGLQANGYRPGWRPEDPCVVQFYGGVKAPEPSGLTISQQNQMGRVRLLGMEFADFEREIRRVTHRLWGASGFNAADDILAIMVNRWPHGYARDHLDLEDKTWNTAPYPNEVGRQTFGRIAIANSDAGADAFTHTAIDQAWRAVQELESA